MEWGKLLKNIAPTIAAALPLPPPFGALASVAVKAALGVDDKAGDDDIAMALAKATPEQIIALKQQEQQLILQLKQLDVDVLEIDAKDRDSARSREAVVGSKMNNYLAFFISTLALIVTIGVFYLFLKEKLSSLTAMEASILTLVASEVYGKLRQICNYCFGSSSGSAVKTDLLARAPAIK